MDYATKNFAAVCVDVFGSFMPCVSCCWCSDVEDRCEENQNKKDALDRQVTTTTHADAVLELEKTETIDVVDGKDEEQVGSSKNDSSAATTNAPLKTFRVRVRVPDSPSFFGWKSTKNDEENSEEKNEADNNVSAAGAEDDDDDEDDRSSVVSTIQFSESDDDDSFSVDSEDSTSTADENDEVNAPIATKDETRPAAPLEFDYRRDSLDNFDLFGLVRDVLGEDDDAEVADINAMRQKSVKKNGHPCVTPPPPTFNYSGASKSPVGSRAVTPEQPQLFDNDNFEVLGKGAFGKVELRTFRGKLVAVKTLIEGVTSSVEMKKMVRHEARVLKRLGTHENVVGLVYYDSETSVLLLEFCGKITLLEYLSTLVRMQITLPPALYEQHLLQLSRGIAKGLAHCHDKNVAHADFKPENIIVGEDGIPKIIDVGLSQLEATEATTDSSGTQLYMAPEKLNCDYILEAIDTGKLAADYELVSFYPKPADVWAYGCVLWALVNHVDLSFARDEFVYRSSEASDVAEKDHGAVKSLVAMNVAYPRCEDAASPVTAIARAIFEPESPEKRPTMPQVVEMLEREPLLN